MSAGRTFLDKVWDQHRIVRLDDTAELLAVDRLLLHDMSGSEAMVTLQEAGRRPMRPEMVFSTVDHFIRTDAGRGAEDAKSPEGLTRLRIARAASRELGLRLYDVDDDRQGITHVVATEFGIALPGMTIVCGDSHTCTLGGVGALAWGIGSSEGAHVLATQTILQSKPKSMAIRLDGEIAHGVESKDVALFLIGRFGAQFGIGHAVEFRGEAVRRMPVEARLTLCNMAVEFSAKYAFVPPDETTFAYLRGREFSPKGEAWEAAVAHWRTLRSDPDAVFDRSEAVDCSAIAPQVTWGISPQHVTGITGEVPDPARVADAEVRQSMARALDYMGLEPGTKMREVPIDAVYVGSCTNARISDLRSAAGLLRGHRVAPGLQAVCVPGSASVKRTAEAEGLDRIFIEAGFEWHESGCGICGGMGNPRFAGRRVASTTNRNFENRQGRGARTHLVNPLTAVASAVRGRLADPRELMGAERWRASPARRASPYRSCASTSTPTRSRRGRSCCVPTTRAGPSPCSATGGSGRTARRTRTSS